MSDLNQMGSMAKSWTAAAVVAFLVFLLLMPGENYDLLASSVLAIITFVVLGMLLTWLAGAGREAPAEAAQSGPSAVEKAAHATGSAVASAGASVADAAGSAKEKVVEAATDSDQAASADKAADGAAGAASTQAAATPDYDGDGVQEGENEGKRPETLSAPRDGAADDLKLIKGVGPKLETMLNDMGFYHFSQIANWSADEVAWVNANLAGFRGRVTRDDWVGQAKVLATGGETEFSARKSD